MGDRLMQFAFTDEQAMIAETAESLLYRTGDQRTDPRRWPPTGSTALWAAFCQELGLAGVAVPGPRPGAGLGLVELAILFEAAGAQVSALCRCWAALAADRRWCMVAARAASRLVAKAGLRAK